MLKNREINGMEEIGLVTPTPYEKSCYDGLHYNGTRLYFVILD